MRKMKLKNRARGERELSIASDNINLWLDALFALKILFPPL
jgi:hypothetical protein